MNEIIYLLIKVMIIIIYLITNIQQDKRNQMLKPSYIAYAIIPFLEASMYQALNIALPWFNWGPNSTEKFPIIHVAVKSIPCRRTSTGVSTVGRCQTRPAIGTRT